MRGSASIPSSGSCTLASSSARTSSLHRRTTSRMGAMPWVYMLYFSDISASSAALSRGGEAWVLESQNCSATLLIRIRVPWLDASGKTPASTGGLAMRSISNRSLFRIVR